MIYNGLTNYRAIMKYKAVLKVSTILVLGIFLILGVLVIKNFVTAKNTQVKSIQVLSQSMEPTIHANSRLYYTPSNGDFAKGDIVVYKMPLAAYANVEPNGIEKENIYISRIIGLPGEIVALENGKILINKQLFHEDYISSDTATHPKNDKTEWILAENEYFLLGDNRQISIDSRSYGGVLLDNVVGIVLSDL